MSSGYICKFEDLQITSVLLDEVMQDREHPGKECMVELDIKVGQLNKKQLCSLLHSRNRCFHKVREWSSCAKISCHENSSCKVSSCKIDSTLLFDWFYITKLSKQL